MPRAQLGPRGKIFRRDTAKPLANLPLEIRRRTERGDHVKCTHLVEERLLWPLTTAQSS